MHNRFSIITSTISWVVLILTAIISIYFYRPPDPVPASAPPQQFSSERAMIHLNQIAAEPHVTGSHGIRKVKNYLLSVLDSIPDISASTQRSTVVAGRTSGRLRMANVENIIAIRKGINSSGALLLMAHYDAVPWSYGATDAGAGVVTLLEVMRAMQHLPPPENDIIFLFSDAEELGLLGAKAFAAEHPLMNDVQVVLNFEGRGAGGPSLMFETSDQNGWLIGEFARAAAQPSGNSLSYEIYKRLPNDTDLSVFKRAGKTGLNFGTIEGHPRYHAATDNLFNVSAESIQDHGIMALALARHFSSINLSNNSAANVVFFDVLGRFLVYYPQDWINPLLIVFWLLLIAVIWLGLKRQILTPGQLALGTFVAFMIVPSVTAVSFILHYILSSLFPGNQWWLLFYRETQVFSSFLIMAIIVFMLAYSVTRDWLDKLNATVGGILFLSMVMTALSIALPGAHFLLFWPLLSLLIFLLPIMAGLPKRWQSLMMMFGAIPTMLIVPPILFGLLVALSVKAIPVITMVAALFMSLLTFHLGQFNMKVAIHNHLFSLGVVILLIVILSFGWNFSNVEPRPSSLVYAVDADQQKAFWMSSDIELDDWQKNIIKDDRLPRVAREFFPDYSSNYFHRSGATAPQTYPAAQAEIISDSLGGGDRFLKILLKQPAGVPTVKLDFSVENEALKFIEINRQTLYDLPSENLRSLTITCHGIEDAGALISLRLTGQPQLSLTAITVDYSLPDLAAMGLPPRPSETMPPSRGVRDATLVRKAFTF